jgi:hypothetical protein
LDDWISVSPESPTSLLSNNTCEEDTGRVTTIAYHHTATWPLNAQRR